MNYKLKRLLLIALTILALTPSARAEGFSAKEVVLEHIKDSHEWHVWGEGENSIVIPLPVIVNSSTGWHVFCSSQFEHHASADGLRHVKADAPADTGYEDEAPDFSENEEFFSDDTHDDLPEGF